MRFLKEFYTLYLSVTKDVTRRQFKEDKTLCHQKSLSELCDNVALLVEKNSIPLQL